MNCYEDTITKLREDLTRYHMEYILEAEEKLMEAEKMDKSRDMRDMLIDRTIVEMRDGTKLMVFGNDLKYKVLVDISDNDFEPGKLYMWDKNLTWLGRGSCRGPKEEYDIVKIYEPCWDFVFYIDEMLTSHYKWAWKRIDDTHTTTRWYKKSDPKPKEMTVAEIEEELGYSVKIIKGDI